MFDVIIMSQVVEARVDTAPACGLPPGAGGCFYSSHFRLIISKLLHKISLKQKSCLLHVMFDVMSQVVEARVDTAAAYGLPPIAVELAIAFTLPIVVW